MQSGCVVVRKKLFPTTVAKLRLPKTSCKPALAFQASEESFDTKCYGVTVLERDVNQFWGPKI